MLRFICDRGRLGPERRRRQPGNRWTRSDVSLAFCLLSFCRPLSRPFGFSSFPATLSRGRRKERKKEKNLPGHRHQYATDSSLSRAKRRRKPLGRHCRHIHTACHSASWSLRPPLSLSAYVPDSICIYINIYICSISLGRSAFFCQSSSLPIGLPGAEENMILLRGLMISV